MFKVLIILLLNKTFLISILLSLGPKYLEMKNMCNVINFKNSPKKKKGYL